MNGSQGITPTIELATTNGNNGFYPYPVVYGNNGFGNNGFFGGDGIWGLILLALLFCNGGFGFGGFGGFGGGLGMTDGGLLGYAIGNNATKGDLSDGLNSLHLSNQVEGVRDDVNDISQAICNSTASINSNISNGFYSNEIANANRQMANMQQSFNNQLSTLQSFNGLERQLCECCADNRLATANLTATVLSENCADRQALSEGIRDVITNATQNTQSVLDKLCQLELSSKEDKIRDLERQLSMADLRASQVAQNSYLTNSIYERLKDCPIGTTPVYGNQPIFTCPNNLGSGCGCNSFYGSNVI